MFVPVVIRGGAVEYSSFEKLEEQLKDMTTPLRAVGDTILESVGKMFETEGASGGRPWDELTEHYRNWKESKVSGLPILVGVKAVGKKGTRQKRVRGKQYARSGKMREEMIAPQSLKVDLTRLLYAPESEIAAFHQEGTPNMVERPPVVIGPQQEAQFEGYFSEWLDSIVDGVGLQ